MAFAFSWLFFSKDHPSKNIEDRNTLHLTPWIWENRGCWAQPRCLRQYEVEKSAFHMLLNLLTLPKFFKSVVIPTILHHLFLERLLKLPKSQANWDVGETGVIIFTSPNNATVFFLGKSLKFTIHFSIKFDPPPPTGPMKSFLGKAREIPTLGRFRKPKALCRMRWAPLRIITPCQFSCFPWDSTTEGGSAAMTSKLEL